MLTVCWAAKGGSGTTVVAVTSALAADRPSLLVDVAGDAPTVLGVEATDRPGVADWLRSEAPPERLAALEQRVDDTAAVVPTGTTEADGAVERWSALARHLAAEPRRVVVDAGTRPPPALLNAADRSLLVTRPCYLALRAAAARAERPTGVVLVDEPGRALRAADVEAAVGAPIVATVLVDPAVARAVDAGLLVSRLPGAYRRAIADAA